MILWPRPCAFRSTVLAKILYCAPAWPGFCSAADRERLDTFLRRCKRLRYCDDNLPAISNLLQDADNQLFNSVLTNTEHVLYHYIPERASHYHHQRRPRVHNKKLYPKPVLAVLVEFRLVTDGRT